jgi:hypothetical protein
MPRFKHSPLRGSLGAALRFRHLLRSAEISAARPHADYRGVGPQDLAA